MRVDGDRFPMRRHHEWTPAKDGWKTGWFLSAQQGPQQKRVRTQAHQLGFRVIGFAWPCLAAGEVTQHLRGRDGRRTSPFHFRH